MTTLPTNIGAAALRWLGTAAFDGTLFAILCWLMSVTLLRRAGGRVLALLWFAALLRFALWSPLELHAVPLETFLRDAPQLAVLAIVSWIACGYALALSALVLRLLVRHHVLARSVDALLPAEPAVHDCVQAAAQQLTLLRAPRVRVTTQSVPPCCVGTLRPTLVLPKWLCEPGPRLQAVLLHELAHLERRDQFTVWIERAVACLFFFWPPVHWVARKLQEAREVACDQRAIECGAFRASEYATYLLEVVAKSRGRAGHEALAIGRTAARLERRIHHLLEDGSPPRPRLRHAALLSLLLMAALIGLRPQLAAPSVPHSQPVRFEQGGCDEASVALQCGP
jgi:beta-lactamase regulating signal transducer with metallopeptidase domain